jgi:hypothetical protein
MSTSHVSSANYPIAQPLATILKASSQDLERQSKKVDEQQQQQPSSEDFDLDFDRESQSDALQHLVRNCFVAMDNVFFST